MRVEHGWVSRDYGTGKCWNVVEGPTGLAFRDFFGSSISSGSGHGNGHICKIGMWSRAPRRWKSSCPIGYTPGDDSGESNVKVVFIHERKCWTARVSESVSRCQYRGDAVRVLPNVSMHGTYKNGRDGPKPTLCTGSTVSESRFCPDGLGTKCDRRHHFQQHSASRHYTLQDLVRWWTILSILLDFISDANSCDCLLLCEIESVSWRRCDICKAATSNITYIIL
jgi:hypothetical protein